MNSQDQFMLHLMAACLMQQSQMLDQQASMLRDLMDHVDAVGDRLWRMDLRQGIPISPLDKGCACKNSAKERYMPTKKAISNKRSNK